MKFLILLFLGLVAVWARDVPAMDSTVGEVLSGKIKSDKDTPGIPTLPADSQSATVQPDAGVFPSSSMGGFPDSSMGGFPGAPQLPSPVGQQPQQGQSKESGSKVGDVVSFICGLGMFIVLLTVIFS
jgi:hypothetical protein